MLVDSEICTKASPQHLLVIVMKTPILIIFFLIISCQKISKSQENFNLPKEQDYNLIIQSILIQDTTFINQGGLKSKFIGSLMIKPHIKFGNYILFYTK